MKEQYIISRRILNHQANCMNLVDVVHRSAGHKITKYILNLTFPILNILFSCFLLVDFTSPYFLLVGILIFYYKSYTVLSTSRRCLSSLLCVFMMWRAYAPSTIHIMNAPSLLLSTFMKKLV
jgi:hypothetical protein